MEPRFDAYTATLRDVPESDLGLLMWSQRQRGDRVKHARGYHGFESRVCWISETGREFGALSFGGQHKGLVMAEMKGSRTPTLVEMLRRFHPGHACTRTDSCVDYDEPGAWERLSGIALAVKKHHGLKGEKRGDWEDFPEDGRTLYLGAASSAVRARVYEKGKHPDYVHLARPDWVRVEVQVRPEKVARKAYSQASAEEVWGASKWTRELAAEILRADLAPLPAYEAREQSELDRALLNLCRQYGHHLVALRDERGDWACVGKAIGDTMSELEQLRRRMH